MTKEIRISVNLKAANVQEGDRIDVHICDLEEKETVYRDRVVRSVTFQDELIELHFDEGSIVIPAYATLDVERPVRQFVVVGSR